MKRWIHAADEPFPEDRLVKMIADECYMRLKDGNGIEVKGSKTRNSYWLWSQEDGNYAIYFDDGNIWRDHENDKEPICFNDLDDAAKWLSEH